VFLNCLGPKQEGGIEVTEDARWKKYEAEQNEKLKDKGRFGMNTRLAYFVAETQEEFDRLASLHPGRILLCDRTFILDTHMKKSIKHTSDLHEVCSIATEVPVEHPRKWPVRVADLPCHCKYCIVNPGDEQCRYKVWCNRRVVDMQVDCLKPAEAEGWVGGKVSWQVNKDLLVNLTIQKFLPESREWIVEYDGSDDNGSGVVLHPPYMYSHKWNYLKMCSAKKLFEKSQSNSTSSMDVVNTADQESVVEDNRVEDWEINKVYEPIEITCSPVMCDGCNKLPSCCMWHKLPMKEEVWNTCLDCQAKPSNSGVGCGGWPDNIDDIPLKTMSQTWRMVMATECSTTTDWTKHSFPNLLFVDRPRRTRT